ncbi:unnamed protein product [Allacma fusca]|uniref:Protein MIX23 n=1 Tax=Allacma fusca TaxID=39272 RepID=A0A8J2PIG2_9HEXA|nr:unnamed protein product [Allacma fusca]
MSVCDDLSEFLETLRNMRLVDDRVVYALNTSIPTQSFAHKVDASATCKDLFTQLVNNHNARDESLKNCLDSTVCKVQKLTEERQTDPANQQVVRALKREQTKLRELQTQVNVEEVIRGRSLKIYNERCRAFYKPQLHK